MISRLSTIAALFAVCATASLAVAGGAHRASIAAPAAAKQVRVVQLEPVVIIAKRSDTATH